MNLTELTPREREIFALAAAGVSNRDIAGELGITENAVRYHLKEIHSKLETGGRRSFLRWYRVRALIPGSLFGSKAATVAATSAVFGVAGVLAVGAVLARPSGENAPHSDNGCPTAFMFMPGTTWDDIARAAGKSIDEVRSLNPGLTTEQLASSYTEVNVGVRENAECGEATPSPPAGTPLRGGTPQAGP